VASSAVVRLKLTAFLLDENSGKLRQHVDN